MYIYIYTHTHRSALSATSLVFVVLHVTLCYPLLATFSVLLPFVTASPPIKSLGFEGFDSSRLLIQRGGNSHVRRIL